MGLTSFPTDDDRRDANRPATPNATGKSQMFFALWLLPLGYLVVRSGYFPRVLGYLLVVACLGYLVDLFAYFLAPGIEGSVLPFSAAAGAIGELAFMAWLLVKGARVPEVNPGIPGVAQVELGMEGTR